MEAAALSEFENKVVLITGAASGIGRATALALNAAGAQLTLVDRNAEGLAETLQLAGGDETRVLTSVVDVLVADQVRAAVDRTVEVFGRLDGAVNSAGIIGLQLLMADYPDEVFQQLLQTNVFAMFLCIKAEAAAMAHAGRWIDRQSRIRGGIEGCTDQCRLRYRQACGRRAHSLGGAFLCSTGYSRECSLPGARANADDLGPGRF